MEDLFRKIFNPIGKERINFHDIRKHPIFVQYFPEKQDDVSKILYKTQSKKIKTFNPKLLVKDMLTKNARTTSGNIVKRSKILQDEENIILK